MRHIHLYISSFGYGCHTVDDPVVQICVGHLQKKPVSTVDAKFGELFIIHKRMIVKHLRTETDSRVLGS